MPGRTYIFALLILASLGQQGYIVRSSEGLQK